MSLRSGKTKAPRPSEREPLLTRTRNLKMARSAHAYERGSTVRFYEWLEASGGKLPKGPPIWIRGDCGGDNDFPSVVSCVPSQFPAFEDHEMALWRRRTTSRTHSS
jgi:hypothetical protein